MGLDLTLLPFDADHPDISFSHTMLDVDRDDFQPIIKIENRLGKDVPDRFTSFRSRDNGYPESHYGVTNTTPYGEKLKFVKVQDIIGAFNDLQDNGSDRNRAIYRYLTALPSHTKIALFWH
jgi:hypothetical protein